MDEIANPLEWAAQWLPSNADPDRPRMTLATNGVDGFPAARTVLLSALTPNGFVFNTDARSRKVADLAQNPKVSLVFIWPGFTRQLVVHGLAQQISVENREATYGKRSPYLKLLAWENTAEFARLSLDERRQRWAELEQQHPDGPTDMSPTWDGYLVEPTRVMFWEAADDTASRRTEYTLHSGQWSIDHLPG
ncbi:MAG TPA: pyridoxamine 5'-phosphate oxidase family protein [Glaciihabitans sp.]|nr:pyridoxamine 5'-phosphate oxidase family protein [Glaciihabitans sp.]